MIKYAKGVRVKLRANLYNMRSPEGFFEPGSPGVVHKHVGADCYVVLLDTPVEDKVDWAFTHEELEVVE